MDGEETVDSDTEYRRRILIKSFFKMRGQERLLTVKGYRQSSRRLQAPLGRMWEREARSGHRALQQKQTDNDAGHSPKPLG
jgi:hypothetical protein